MAKETIEKPKRGRGRPRKDAVPPAPIRGGARKGAGRKAGVSVGPYNATGKALSKSASFCINEDTYRRIKELREMTKDDTLPFNRMFEAWVEEIAKDYGIE